MIRKICFIYYTNTVIYFIFGNSRKVLKIEKFETQEVLKLCRKKKFVFLEFASINKQTIYNEFSQVYCI